MDERAALAVEFDPQAAAACIEDYADAACPDEPRKLYGLKTNCNRMFKGLIEPGQPCRDSDECRAVPPSTAHCDVGFTGLCEVSPSPSSIHARLGETCGGTCRNWLYEGDDCEGPHLGAEEPEPDRELPFCFTADGLQCTGEAGARTCQPLIQRGQDCSRSGAGCVRNAYCRSESQTCEAQDASGPCTGLDDVCGPNAYCDSTESVCVALGKMHGESCERDDECEDLYCNPVGVCQGSITASACAGPVSLD